MKQDYNDRFYTFNTWREALEKEWNAAPQTLQAKTQEITDAKKAYFAKYNKHLDKKLMAYDYYPAFKPMVQAINNIRGKDAIIDKNVKEIEAILDDRFNRLAQSRSELTLQNKQFKFKNNELKQQWEQVLQLEMELKPLNNLESQKKVTLECIDALEKADDRTERVLNHNSSHPYLHKDIKDGLYVEHLNRMRQYSKPSAKPENVQTPAIAGQTEIPTTYYPLLPLFSSDEKIWSKDFKSANTSWAERSQSPRSDSPNSSRL